MPLLRHSSNASVTAAAQDRLQEPALDAGGDDGSQIEEGTRGRGEASDAGKNSIAHHQGNAVSVTGQDFGDKEGVPERHGIEPLGGAMRLLSQVGDRLLRQGSERQACHRLAWQITRSPTTGDARG